MSAGSRRFSWWRLSLATLLIRTGRSRISALASTTSEPVTTPIHGMALRRRVRGGVPGRGLFGWVPPGPGGPPRPGRIPAGGRVGAPVAAHRTDAPSARRRDALAATRITPSHPIRVACPRARSLPQCSSPGPVPEHVARVRRHSQVTPSIALPGTPPFRRGGNPLLFARDPRDFGHVRPGGRQAPRGVRAAPSWQGSDTDARVNGGRSGGRAAVPRASTREPVHDRADPRLGPSTTGPIHRGSRSAGEPIHKRTVRRRGRRRW